jgi:hypothetical protein
MPIWRSSGASSLNRLNGWNDRRAKQIGSRLRPPLVSDAPHSKTKINTALLCRRNKDPLGVDYVSIGANAGMGKTIFRSTQARFAVAIVFAIGAVSLAAASVRAFNQESGGSGGSENFTFSDPDEQVNIFGQGAEPQSFGSSGSVQFDAQQQGRLNVLKHLQINSLTSPPDPLSRPGN